MQFCYQKGLRAIGSTVQYLVGSGVDRSWQYENKVGEETMVNIFLLFEAEVLGHQRIQCNSYVIFKAIF